VSSDCCTTQSGAENTDTFQNALLSYEWVRHTGHNMASCHFRTCTVATARWSIKHRTAAFSFYYNT